MALQNKIVTAKVEQEKFEKYIIEQANLIIIINNPSINDFKNKQDLHVYNDYMDTLGLDGLELGSVSDQA